jgi:hypothetical protein
MVTGGNGWMPVLPDMECMDSPFEGYAGPHRNCLKSAAAQFQYQGKITRNDPCTANRMFINFRAGISPFNGTVQTCGLPILNPPTSLSKEHTGKAGAN